MSIFLQLLGLGFEPRIFSIFNFFLLVDLSIFNLKDQSFSQSINRLMKLIHYFAKVFFKQNDCEQDEKSENRWNHYSAKSWDVVASSWLCNRSGQVWSLSMGRIPSFWRNVQISFHHNFSPYRKGEIIIWMRQFPLYFMVKVSLSSTP